MIRFIGCLQKNERDEKQEMKNKRPPYGLQRAFCVNTYLLIDNWFIATIWLFSTTRAINIFHIKNAESH